MSDRLLTDGEIQQVWCDSYGFIENFRAVAKAQDAKTYPVGYIDGFRDGFRKSRKQTLKEMGEWLYNNRGTVSYLTPQEVEVLRQGKAPWEMP